MNFRTGREKSIPKNFYNRINYINWKENIPVLNVLVLYASLFIVSGLLQCPHRTAPFHLTNVLYPFITSTHTKNNGRGNLFWLDSKRHDRLFHDRGRKFFAYSVIQNDHAPDCNSFGKEHPRSFHHHPFERIPRDRYPSNHSMSFRCPLIPSYTFHC